VRSNDRAYSRLPELIQPLHAFVSETDVPHGQDLIDEEDLGVDIDGCGKCQSQTHTIAVGSPRLIHELFELGELSDFSQPSHRLTTSKAGDDCSRNGVLLTRKQRMKRFTQR
jgi:hypothetical protein